MMPHGTFDPNSGIRMAAQFAQECGLIRFESL